MDFQRVVCYNGTNCITNAPALLVTAEGVSQRSVLPMTTPIVVPPIDSDNLKRCPKCGQFKPRTEFYRNRSRYDGLHAECKACEFVARLIAGKIPHVIPVAPDMKVCPGCDTAKPRCAFSADRTQADGIQTVCKPCQAARTKAWREAHGEEVKRKRYEYNMSEYGRAKRKAYNAEYRRTHKQYFDDYMAVWRVENADHCREYTRQYRECNADRIAIYAMTHRAQKAHQARIYRQTNHGKDLARKHKANRRARELIGDAVSITNEDMAAIRAAQTDKKGRLICWRCHKPITDTPHLDHFIPLAKGGAHAPGNLHYMHAKCNLNKSDKHPHDIGLLI